MSNIIPCEKLWGIKKRDDIIYEEIYDNEIFHSSKQYTYDSMNHHLPELVEGDNCKLIKERHGDTSLLHGHKHRLDMSISKYT